VRQLYLNFGGESDGDFTGSARQGARHARHGPVANNARPAPDEIRALVGRGGVKVLTPCFGAFGRTKAKNST
jgi:hypothetical protein